MHKPPLHADRKTEHSHRSDIPPTRTLRERVYWHDSWPANPADYFAITRDRSWIEIVSRGTANAYGQINLFKRHVAAFFHVLREGVVTDYADWACNPYPTGGTPLLMRMRSVRSECGEFESVVQPAVDGMLCIDPDTLPSSGRIYLGSPDQELKQLAALWQLLPIIKAIAVGASPTIDEQNAARNRASVINAQVHGSHLPTSGYCPWCECDASLELLNRNADRRITGCPICHHTWCD